MLLPLGVQVRSCEIDDQSSGFPARLAGAVC
ncbi:hypothetical protein L915_11187 [Phytophthora nicotianae]|uniref:Uncharacterized protein n=1 Tax=Phytophthora nicotianae TaxID=4792 RepID=W2GKV5_PHYNI|nr:hypothetical protein L915_11187 [Phytophthora nicotianae]